METDCNRSKNRIYKVVLTGGPCGGKTTAQERLRTFFEGIGWKVYTVPETATFVAKGGLKFDQLTDEEVFEYQKGLLQTMLTVESLFSRLADLSTSDHNQLLIYDRGAMDPSAYMNSMSWRRLLTELKLNQFSLREGRYDQVIHLTTAADGAEAYYTLSNNAIRRETLEQAIDCDRKTRNAWLGHQQVDVIENKGCRSFDDKILRLIAAICNRIGLATKDRLDYDSKKRKWLVDAVCFDRMPRYESFLVRHTYLCTEHKNTQARLRSRSQCGRNTYTITTRDYSAPRPIETRMQISFREYLNYKKMEDRSRASINKERRCFMYDKQYFHIDIYKSPLPPSRNGQTLIILETYTTALVGCKDEPLLPDFMTVAREITNDPDYSMYKIAIIDPKIDHKMSS